MIQRANDPNASGMNWRPAANDAKASQFDPKRSRAGHAWPFLSRDVARLGSQPASKVPVSNDHGS